MPEYEALLHPDTGEQIGWTIEADDGALIAVDFDGAIVGAVDPATNELLDHSEYELSAGDDYGNDDQAAAFEQRLGDLEAAAYEPREPTYVPYPVVPEVDRERQELDLDAQAAHLEARLGRPLLLSEKRQLGQQLTEAEIGGEDRIDLPAAVDRLRERGQPLLDLDSGSLHQQREARQEYARQRIADSERVQAAEAGEDNLVNPQPPPSREAYDLDDREERQSYMLDRMRGVTDESATYSTDEYADAWEEYENQ